MGLAAEHCATECKISREEQDAYSIEAYKRAQAAWEKGSFSEEVIPISIPQKKGPAVIMDKDEEPWAVNFEKIPTLQPAFKKEGTVTAANASTMNDGAAALVLMSKEKADALRVMVKSKKSSTMNERLLYKVTASGISLLWENLEVPVSIK
jgi:acetyl-CoA C-acetyltransferase